MGDIYHKGDTYAGSVPIDDTQTTAINTWSAQKINSLLPIVANGLTLGVNASGQNYVNVPVEGATADMVVMHICIGDPSKVSTAIPKCTPYDGGVKVEATVTAQTTIDFILMKGRTTS